MMLTKGAVGGDFETSLYELVGDALNFERLDAALIANDLFSVFKALAAETYFDFCPALCASGNYRNQVR
jgi:hypothetical protein